MPSAPPSEEDDGTETLPGTRDIVGADVSVAERDAVRGDGHVAHVISRLSTCAAEIELRTTYLEPGAAVGDAIHLEGVALVNGDIAGHVLSGSAMNAGRNAVEPRRLEVPVALDVENVAVLDVAAEVDRTRPLEPIGARVAGAAVHGVAGLQITECGRTRGAANDGEGLLGRVLLGGRAVGVGADHRHVTRLSDVAEDRVDRDDRVRAVGVATAGGVIARGLARVTGRARAVAVVRIATRRAQEGNSACEQERNVAGHVCLP